MPILPRRSVLAPIAAAFLWAATPGGLLAAEVAEGVVGNPQAPVTMIEYSSLTCPHCAAFHEETLPGLKERYIDTGKVRLVLRDFPLDETALQAAVIAHCAGPERYPTFVDVFFDQQESWARASDPAAALKQLAKLGGLGESEIDACLADRAMEEAVLQMRLEGQQQFEIRSTPTFIINGRAYPGNRSVDEFAAIIDPLLTGGTNKTDIAPGSAPSTAAATPAQEPAGLVDRLGAWLRSVLARVGLA